MKVTTGILVLALAWGICAPAAAIQNKIINNEQTRVHDHHGVGPIISNDYGKETQQQKPQTPASGTSSTPGTASQTQTAPAKPPKQPKPIIPPDTVDPKPSKPSNLSNTGSTQGETVTLPNGTTVYKGVKIPKTLR